MNDWRHQSEAAQVCTQAHQQPRSKVLVQLPTGTGKTAVAIKVAVQYITRPFARALVVVPTEPILEQFEQRLARATRVPIHRDKAGRHAPYGAKLVIASQNSLWDRLHRYDPDTLCIYDECHHANFDAAENLKIASAFKHVVGLSASPWSNGCEVMFSDAARVTLGLSEAQSRGILAPLVVEDWVEPWGPHGLVFCTSNAEAQRLSAEHPGSTWVGVNSGAVSERVAAWRAGRFTVIYANRMLSEGFDEPRCSGVWIGVESDSDIRYVQMAGRALRALPGKVAHLYCRTTLARRRLVRALGRAGWNDPVLTAE